MAQGRLDRVDLNGWVVVLVHRVFLAKRGLCQGGRAGGTGVFLSRFDVVFQGKSDTTRDCGDRDSLRCDRWIDFVEVTRPQGSNPIKH